MGLILKKVVLEDYTDKKVLYSKLVRNNLDFTIETHHLESGKHLQIFLYRNHPRIKEFIDIRDKKNHLTEQITQIETNPAQMRLAINDTSFMIAASNNSTIKITEYNFNQSLADFAKGKVAILIDITFEEEVDNNKLVSELRSFNNMEDKNEGTSN
jgi:hypothetical protein